MQLALKTMDISEVLKQVENSLRDLLNYLLTNELGDDWCLKSGVSKERIKIWQERKEIDEKKFGHSDPRLIYYADFYDLKTIIKKSWGKGISSVFGKLKELEVYLDCLDELRNPEAHRREFLPYQKQLALGISGKIRTQITEYFSNMETGDSYYPRIESVQDSLGNTWSSGSPKNKNTKSSLRPSDLLQFTISATDPMGEELQYTVLPQSLPYEFEWENKGGFELIINESHVSKILWIAIAIKSSRQFHATSEVGLGKVDDVVKFGYEILPPRL